MQALSPGPVILLTGMKHSGKSSHGRALGNELGLPFFDLDDVILHLYRQGGGSLGDIRSIYREEGKDRFMELEAAAASKVMEQEQPCIVAAGGGLADNGEAFDRFSGDPRVFILHLSIDEETSFRRIMAGGIPPFLQDDRNSMDDPAAMELEAGRRYHILYQRREGAYRRSAHLTLELPDLPEEENRRKVIDAARKALVHVTSLPQGGPIPEQ